MATIRTISEGELLVSSSPHVHARTSIRTIMRDVLVSLIPAFIASVVFFGLRALVLISVCIATCVLAEFVSRRVMGRSNSVGDLSAIVTGLLLAFNLPAGLPIWMAIVGSLFAIVIAKQVFGGLGYNPFNPALVARAFLLVSFTGAMTTWTPSDWMQKADRKDAVRIVEQQTAGAKSEDTLAVVSEPYEGKKHRHKDPSDKLESVTHETENEVDAVTTATPLGVVKSTFKGGGGVPFKMDRSMVWRFFVGDINGCLGETSALALLLGGIYLIIRKVISWHIPVSYLGTVALYASILHWAMPESSMPVSFHLLAGGLFLGAFFMATDMVTSPTTKKGQLIFGVGCGILTMVIRTVSSGDYPEGVSFAILIMNAFVPLINRVTRIRPFGEKHA